MTSVLQQGCCCFLIRNPVLRMVLAAPCILPPRTLRSLGATSRNFDRRPIGTAFGAFHCDLFFGVCVCVCLCLWVAAVLVCLVQPLGVWVCCPLSVVHAFSQWSFGSKCCEVFFGLRSDGAVLAAGACGQLLLVLCCLYLFGHFGSMVSCIKGFSTFCS